MTKKELYCMLKDLDANLQTRIDEQQKVIDFLCEHEKDDVYIDCYSTGFGKIDWYAVFLYKSKLKTVDLVYTSLHNYSFEIKDNCKESFVVRTKLKQEEKETIKYFKVEKSNCKIMNVTEFFEGKTKRRNKKCSN